MKIEHVSSSRNYKLTVCGPVNNKTTHDKNHAVTLRKYFHYRWGVKGKSSHSYYKLLTNKAYFKALAPSDEIGTIEWEIICPVCCDHFGARDKLKGVVDTGRQVNFMYANNVDVVSLPDKTAIVVCSTKCKQLFEISPMIYERNYL